ncbi:hypothetical protein P5P86_11735 [Nocardioides sp. BP30]|uniref:hypothetical protein n=1 Tax=Nocardioides sp. BP30 TaxID=3036374 RepID=UPI002469082C|nr:hypothetical protein [Nocardioides sp. BP30]WGL50635.1 hypothetical protein P5P86_11735 [Nocardioides sp. BP30]
MADEPGGWELKRTLEALERGMREGFAQTNARLDKLVTQDAFQAEQRRVEDRLKAIEREQAEEKADRIEAVATEKREREAGDKGQQNQLDKFSSNFRWLFASMVIPIACVLLAWFLARGGAR